MQARLARRFLFCLALAATAAPVEALAQGAWVGEKGNIGLSLDYQFVDSDVIVEDPDLEFPGEPITNQNVIFTAEYNPIERLGLTLSLPLLLAKYGGDGSQFPRHGDWDDGDYHGSLQDLGLRARYMLLDAPVAISPHLGVTVPVSDYPTSGFANAGRHLVAGVVGASIGSVFAERVYVHLFYELGIPQKADDSEEHEEFSQLKSDIAAQLGVLVTPAIEVHLAVDWHLQHDGVAYSELTDPNSPLFLEHDRVLDEDWLYGGIGASWLIANQWTLGAEFRRYLTGSNTRKVTSLGVSLGYDFTL